MSKYLEARVQSDRVPELSFGPDRERYITVKALHLASKSILADAMSTDSDTKDMQEILEKHYHHTWNSLQFEDDLREAVVLGFQLPEGGACATDLIAFLADHRGRKV